MSRRAIFLPTRRDPKRIRAAYREGADRAKRSGAARSGRGLAAVVLEGVGASPAMCEAVLSEGELTAIREAELLNNLDAIKALGNRAKSAVETLPGTSRFAELMTELPAGMSIRQHPDGPILRYPDDHEISWALAASEGLIRFV